MKLIVLTIALLVVCIHPGSVDDTFGIGGLNSYRAKHSNKRKSFDYLESVAEGHPMSFPGDEGYLDHYLASMLNTNSSDAKTDPFPTQEQPILKCEESNKSQYFKFTPVHLASLKPGGPAVKFQNNCFKTNEMRLEVVDDETYQVILKAEDPSGMTCADVYLYSTIANYKFELAFFEGEHVNQFKVSPVEKEMINNGGVYIATTCAGITDSLSSLVKTLGMFVGGFGLNPNIPFFGGRVMDYQVKNSIEFIKEATGYQWEERPIDEVVELSEDDLQSGDFLAVTRFDGLDQIIHWGSGSHVGHCTMVLKVNGSAYVVESQSAWYWPRHNIQINPYKQWIEWARNAGYLVSLVPLRKEIAQKFDSEAAYEYFKTIEDVPYGFHNFIFGWVDTTYNSLPHILEVELVPAIFAVVESIIPSAVESIFTLGLNKRLGTEGLKVAEVVHEANKRGLTMRDLLAMPEDDAWVYPYGPSLVCSSLIVSMYKAAGLFDGIEVHATEFTPRDLYELDFFDPNPEVPENCKKIDPTNPLCQIMGSHRIEFPTMGTISPYPKMNQQCHSEAPRFARFPDQC